MSSPTTKTPTKKSERTRLLLESADKMIAEAEKKRREDEIKRQETEAKYESDVKALRDQFADMLREDEDELETVQDDYEPNQLLSDLPLKDAAASDSAEDQDSPSAGRQATVPFDSYDGVPFDFEPFVTGHAAVYEEEDSQLVSGEQVLNVPGQDTARRTSRRQQNFKSGGDQIQKSRGLHRIS